MEYRNEEDSMGTVQVPADCFWGAQTQRSFQNFKIGSETIPVEIIHAFAILKKAAAITNCSMGKLDSERCDLIEAACDEISSGALDSQFPLKVWQTGSGTQTNMNVNEVIAHRGNEIAGKKLLHPNDHVNMSQSSNDTFPTALHIAAYLAVAEGVLPSLRNMVVSLKCLEERSIGAVTTGRTHLQDAVPIGFSQEVSGWRAMLERIDEMVSGSLAGLQTLALGGTAVGTGLNAPEGFDIAVAQQISELTHKDFVTAPNKFHALSSQDEIAFTHGGLRALAADLMKIANDVRWLASGPRCGLGEITIPANEPGSSIMPGKVNPTQCEALTMVAAQVMGNDATVGFAASQGNFQLNVFMPVIAFNFMQSARLLTDAMRSFTINCVDGIEPNREKMNDNLHRSLMLVTALNPYIGYDNSSKVAKLAHNENISLKEATLSLGLMDEEKFDDIFHPEQMI